MLTSPRSLAVATFATVAVAGLGALAAHFKEAEPGSPPASRAVQAAPRTALPAKKRQIAEPLPPLSSVPVVGREEAERELADAEFVLGTTVGGEARAYPFNMLADPTRELLNDTLGAQPIAVAWCDQCQCPRVFSRTLAGQTLTFQLTGETRDDNMVMRDLETGSEWAQLLGEATDGPLRGQHLDAIAAAWTDWKTWRTAHPETTVLMLPRVVPIYRHVEGYSDAVQERQYFNRLQWGLERHGKSRSWPFGALSRQPLVNSTLDDLPIVVIFNRRECTVTAFRRNLDGAVLTFRRDGARLVDDQSGTTWDPITGKATEGFHRGAQLEPVAGTVSLRDKWQRFHEQTEVWAPGE
jgi:hypothetical protein